MELFDTILAFMDKGGNVLWIIATLVFFMWTLIIERFIYFLGGGVGDRPRSTSSPSQRG